MEHVKFSDFCGKYKVPLLQYLCSPRYCTSSSFLYQLFNYSFHLYMYTYPPHLLYSKILYLRNYSGIDPFTTSFCLRKTNKTILIFTNKELRGVSSTWRLSLLCFPCFCADAASNCLNTPTARWKTSWARSRCGSSVSS